MKADPPAAHGGSGITNPEHTIYSGLKSRISSLRVPKTFGELLAYLVCAWLTISVVIFFLSLWSTLMSYVALLAFVIVTLSTAHQVYLLMRARQRVLADKDVPLLWGFVRLVAWDPIEGVLFLENKSLGFSDDNLHDGQGGVRFIFPILGEELALRIPLEVQTLQFCDEKVLTREYLSVTVLGTVKWRILDIRKFYLLVSRELRTTADHANVTNTDYTSPGASRAPIAQEQIAASSIKERINLAIMWLRVLAEEQTRTVVSRVSSGLLIADRLSTELPEIKAATQDRSLLGALAAAPPQTGAPEWTGATDGLARSIYDTMAARVTPYGITIEEVSLREIRLPDDVVQQCIEAAKAAYLPLLSQRKAAAEVAVRRATLAADVELLGREAVAARQVVEVAPAYALADFLSDFVRKSLGQQGGAGLATSVAAAGILGNVVQSAGALPNQKSPSSALPAAPVPSTEPAPSPEVPTKAADQIPSV